MHVYCKFTSFFSLCLPNTSTVLALFQDREERGYSQKQRPQYSCCFDYCCFEVKNCDKSSFGLFSSGLLWLLWSFVVPWKSDTFLVYFFKWHWNFGGNCIKSVYSFRLYAVLPMLFLPIHEHIIPFYLFVSFSMSFNNAL